MAFQRKSNISQDLHFLGLPQKYYPLNILQNYTIIVFHSVYDIKLTSKCRNSVPEPQKSETFPGRAFPRRITPLKYIQKYTHLCLNVISTQLIWRKNPNIDNKRLNLIKNIEKLLRLHQMIACFERLVGARRILVLYMYISNVQSRMPNNC